MREAPESKQLVWNRHYSAWSEVLGADLREVLIFHPTWWFTSQLLVTSLPSSERLSTWCERWRADVHSCATTTFWIMSLSGWPWQGWPLAVGDKGLSQHHIPKCIICLRTTLYNGQDPYCLFKTKDGHFIRLLELLSFQLDCHGHWAWLSYGWNGWLEYGFYMTVSTEEVIVAPHNGSETLSVFNKEKYVLPESKSSNLWSDWSSLPASPPSWLLKNTKNLS